MKLVFLGPPGAGKGTQAAMVCDALSIPHISTGAMLRDAIAAGTELGLKAKAIMDTGALVPDDVVIGIVREKLASPACANGYLLDGFPRTLVQAEALEGFATLDAVVNVDVPAGKIVARISGRRVCAACGHTFHVDTLEDEACTQCGGALHQRDDDKPETVENRLRVYEAQTKPLIEFYARKRILLTVDGDQPIEAVYGAIMEALEKVRA